MNMTGMEENALMLLLIFGLQVIPSSTPQNHFTEYFAEHMTLCDAGIQMIKVGNIGNIVHGVKSPNGRRHRHDRTCLVMREKTIPASLTGLHSQ